MTLSSFQSSSYEEPEPEVLREKDGWFVVDGGDVGDVGAGGDDDILVVI